MENSGKIGAPGGSNEAVAIQRGTDLRHSERDRGQGLGQGGLPAARISPATFYQWKSKCGGLEPSDLKKLKDLERENTRLKQLYAALSLENQALKDLVHRKL